MDEICRNHSFQTLAPLSLLQFWELLLLLLSLAFWCEYLFSSRFSTLLKFYIVVDFCELCISSMACFCYDLTSLLAVTWVVQCILRTNFHLSNVWCLVLSYQLLILSPFCLYFRWSMLDVNAVCNIFFNINLPFYLLKLTM